jgi:predicted anti-sigma-YlaC factor YlaD
VRLLEASCEATSEALSDRLDGELRWLRRQRVAHHIARCGRCRETFASLSRLVRALQLIRDEETVDGSSVVNDVLARIREGSAADGGS